jgi:hypothetical protein
MLDKVEIVLMIISYIAMFNCIVRSDYNLVVALVCFFYWNSRKTKTRRVANIIYIVLAIVTIFDIVWLILVWKSWTGSNWASPVWNRLRFWHITVIVLTITNMVLKVLSMVLVFLEARKSNPYKQIEENNTAQKGGYNAY